MSRRGSSILRRRHCGRQNDPGLVLRNSCQALAECLALLLAHARAQHDQMPHALHQLSLEPVEMVVALREHERRPPRVDRLEDVGQTRWFRASSFTNSWYSVWNSTRLSAFCARAGWERRRLHEGEVLERPSSRLYSRIDAVPDRATLHEDDRVVSVFRPRWQTARARTAPLPVVRPARSCAPTDGGTHHNQVAVAAHTIIDDPFLTRL